MGSEDILRPSEARGTCCACCRIARNTLFRMRRRSTCRSACEWTVLHFPDLAYGQDSSASLTKSVSAPRAPKKKVTHERRKADSTLSVFHVSPGKATKLSYEILNLAKEGETFGGTQSSGNGNTMPVVLYCALFVMAASQESMIC